MRSSLLAPTAPLLVSTACGSVAPSPTAPSAPPEASAAIVPAGVDEAAVEAASAVAVEASVPVVPLEPFVTLEVYGYDDATLSQPTLLASDPSGQARPVVVALHGLRGRADWTCHVARQLFESRAFVLCPAGTPLPAKTAADRARPRYTLPDPHRLGLEIDAGLAALQARYGSAVDVENPVLYGHSLGAIFGASLAVAHPATWPRVILSEGGYSAMAFPGARAFAKHGGQRVLFACGTKACDDGAKGAVRALDAAGAKADIGYVPGAGHRSWGPIVDVMRDRVSWLLEGDRRFGDS